MASIEREKLRGKTQKKDVNKDTNAATRDSDPGGARQNYARRREGRRSRRRKWIKEQKSRGRKRGQGHVARRQIGWAAESRWRRVIAASTTMALKAELAATLKEMAAMAAAGGQMGQQKKQAAGGRKQTKEGKKVIAWGGDMLDAVGEGGGDAEELKIGGVEGTTAQAEREWAILVEQMRTQVDEEWRSEGKYYNHREWKKKEKMELEQEAWARADLVWKQRVAVKIKELETSRVAERQRHEFVETRSKMEWPVAGGDLQHTERRRQADADRELQWTDPTVGWAPGAPHSTVPTVGWAPDDPHSTVLCGARGADVTESRAAWAEVSRDRMGELQRQATRQMVCEDRFPQLVNGTLTWRAIQDAVQGREEFVVTEVCTGVFRFDYSDPNVTHFSAKGGEDIKRAWMRREMRGMVVRDTGEVMVRGLHKFFNLGQLKETQVGRLKELQVMEVLTKLDGQMIIGVVIGDEVEYWSRKGKTSVGVTAARMAHAAEGDYDNAVQRVFGQGATMVFEMIGTQSKIKSNEGTEPRLVLTAIRQHDTGRYWRHAELIDIGKGYGIEVVQRRRELEGMDIRQIANEVDGWRGKEGVIVRMSDQAMIKVKSQWWFRAGYCKRFRNEAEKWRAGEVIRREKMEARLHTRGQRLAITRSSGVHSPQHIFGIMATAQRVDAVYNMRGKLTVMIVGFSTAEERDEAKVVATMKGWRATQAYSNRTRGKVGRRMEVFKREMI